LFAFVLSAKIGIRINNDVKETSSLIQPPLLQVIPTVGYIYGMTVLNEEIFVVRSSRQVGVYKSLTFTSQLTIPGAKTLVAIVACLQNNCLYMSDFDDKTIYRFDPQLNKVINQWSVNDSCRGLSLTKSHNLLATLHGTKQIEEYSPDGNLLRAISLDKTIDCPYHCIEIFRDQFVVSYGDVGTEQKESGVCIVDSAGRIIESYKGPKRSEHDAKLMRGLRHMAVDEHNRVIVADYSNDRVELLSPTLNHLSYIEVPGEKLDRPYALHLDELNHRLYIGEWRSGHVYVLDQR